MENKGDIIKTPYLKADDNKIINEKSIKWVKK